MNGINDFVKKYNWYILKEDKVLPVNTLIKHLFFFIFFFIFSLFILYIILDWREG